MMTKESNVQQCHKHCGIFTPIVMTLAMLAMIFAILAYRDSHKTFNYMVNQVGGIENFEKLNTFYATDDFKKGITTQIEASITQ
jgi:hypothetical protein